MKQHIAFTPYRMQCLEHLARYYYLTRSQLIRLGVTTNNSNLARSVLTPLLNHSPALIQQGRLNAISYSLTRAGAEFIGNELGAEVPFPSKHYTPVDFEHRCECIDFLIALYGFDGVEVEWHRPDFRGEGAQRGPGKFVSLTTHRLRSGQVFRSDLDLLLKFPDGKARLFAFEYHRRTKSLFKLWQQLDIHRQALHQGVIPARYKYPASNYVISLYKEERTMRKVQERIASDDRFEAYQRLFLFNTLEQVVADFGEGWTDFLGHEVELFGSRKSAN